jgi:hypothetical protein
MADFFAQIERMWDTIRHGQLPLPMVAAIAPDRCAPDGAAGVWIRPDEAYFTLRVNEMHLSANREWYVVYDPLVLVLTEFNYGNQRVTVPRVVGPSLIGKQTEGQTPKHGSLLLDTSVAGPCPYRGGDIDVSISFYQIVRHNYARKLLSVVERLSGALGAAAQLSTIAKTGAALLEGVEGLLGLDGTVMLAGQRISLTPSPLDPLRTGFYAILTPPVPTHPDKLCVRDRRLHTSGAAGTRDRTPYRESDFVLLGISGSEVRGDDSLLPFNDLKMDAMRALWDGADGVEIAKANLIAAYQQMRTNPDVTKREASMLFDRWLIEFEEERKRVGKVRSMSDRRTRGTPPELAADVANALRRIEERARVSDGNG